MKKLILTAFAAGIFFTSCESTYICNCDAYDTRTGATTNYSREIDGTRASAASECAGSTSSDPNIGLSGCALESDPMNYYDSY